MSGKPMMAGFLRGALYRGRRVETFTQAEIALAEDRFWSENVVNHYGFVRTPRCSYCGRNRGPEVTCPGCGAAK